MTLGDGVVPSSAYQALLDKVSELEKAERVQRALYAISELSGAQLEMSVILSRLHGIISELMYADNFFIARYDQDSQHVRFLYFADVATPFSDVTAAGMEAPIPLDDIEYSLTWYTIRLGKPLRGTLDKIGAELPGEFRPLGVAPKDWLGVPMLEGSQVHGILVVQHYEEAEVYGPEDQALLSFVASHILTTLQRREYRENLERAVALRTRELADANAKLLQEIAERKRNELIQRALYHIAEQAGDTGREKDFYRTIHYQLGSLLYADNFFIALLVDDGEAIDFAYYANDYDPPSPKRRLRDGLTEHVLRLGADVLLDKRQIAALEAEGSITIKGRRPHSWLGVPLRCEGRVLGVMAVQSYRDDTLFQPKDSELLRFVSSQIASSLERKRALASLREAKATLELRVRERTWELEKEIATRKTVEQQLKHEVMHDHLTGLPNRAHLLERLEQLPRRRDAGGERSGFAIMFLDVDSFKAINDEHGHIMGDMVLREIAERLKQSVRPPGLAARLSGDEFAILLEGIEHAEEAITVATRFLRALEHPVSLAGISLNVSVSIGIAMLDEHEMTHSDVLGRADKAMYQAKSEGRSLYRLYSSSTESSPGER
ncbi:diguanylate cyclase [Halomonas sp. ANAO-440]|uniref:sensor domain-containing diguanylate cyclase n=1 Tax=Halomonas sp. ANAO-440 TaxID=2861360 RepID=UPI001CAA7706|nr:diguanylate cyclase [Halomonas sp. ANAO-440]MBZ0330736.1 diguanylate cyclase [Halomonas sp. ANAO-440]